MHGELKVKMYCAVTVTVRTSRDLPVAFGFSVFLLLANRTASLRILCKSDSYGR
jgi:hypothetical protein